MAYGLRLTADGSVVAFEPGTDRAARLFPAAIPPHEAGMTATLAQRAAAPARRDKIRVGVIGTGIGSAIHIPALQHAGDFEVAV